MIGKPHSASVGVGSRPLRGPVRIRPTGLEGQPAPASHAFPRPIWDLVVLLGRLVVHREARVADALAVFREARTLWIDEDCGDGDGDVELKLRRATRSVRRSLVDVSALFFGAEALVPMRLPRLDASRSADPLEAARVRDFAADWAADAVARVRRSATRTLSAIGDASTARLRQLFVSLRAECSQGLGELADWRAAPRVSSSERAVRRLPKDGPTKSL
ncbi:hypothetical protein M885DRAFT_498782 [Pelagophyceae sp. CCMP2097]|nr:hypothetical protein M885DRAFT_498782 [Pelagophyceae sp. CCMP2097]